VCGLFKNVSDLPLEDTKCAGRSFWCISSFEHLVDILSPKFWKNSSTLTTRIGWKVQLTEVARISSA
jgi:hypothetical protein